MSRLFRPFLIFIGGLPVTEKTVGAIPFASKIMFGNVYLAFYNHLYTQYGLSLSVAVAVYIVKGVLFWGLILAAGAAFRRKKVRRGFLCGLSAVCISVTPYLYLLLAANNVPQWAFFAVSFAMAATLSLSLLKFRRMRRAISDPSS